MVNLVYSPPWFYGIDIVIDVVSVVVLFLIAYYTRQYYKLNRKNKNYLLFSGGALLLMISFLFKITTNFVIYNVEWHTKQIGFITIAYQTIEQIAIFSIWGTLLFRFLTLLGFYLLFLVYYKNQGSPLPLFTIYFLILITYFTSSAHYIFHLTTLLFILSILYKLRINSKNNKEISAKVIYKAFMIIALSQLIFIFLLITRQFYVLAELIQLLGYGLLLTGFIMVKHYGKKKNKN
ncbi:hypothetical protein COY27_06045 [Candidatus Woesearchaeota archaeon CG_4_10_14_0_2_um_filter_33_13]|nr:MAG: hypothetical protein COY27_06045 [Candidatus Woesearchaeota archaeon CG_4_10_14_0_2_um_filter_33_13]